MPPRAVKRPSTPATSTLKKKLLPPSSPIPNDDVPHLHSFPRSKENQREFILLDDDRAERLELEDNDPQFETEGDSDANIRADYYPGIDGRDLEETGGQEIINGDDALEEMVQAEEEEIEEVEEVGEQADEYEDEHHIMVKERKKKKQLEVFVGGLDRDATEEDLRKVFSEVGEITEVRLMRNPITYKNKGFAFLRFATVEQAKRAINELRHPVINGKRFGVAPSQDSDTLFVGNICKTWTKELLKERLEHYGVNTFEDLTLVEDTKIEGMNRGFAFLDFSSREDALEACKRLQKRDVVFGLDRTARVAFADTFIEPDDEIMSHVRTIFLDGLPPKWDEERIKQYLKKFGRIEKVELARNMPAAKRIDFGFVTFDTHESAVACVDGINDAVLGDGDKKVRARLSRPRQRGKSAKLARGGYPIEHGGRGHKLAWDSSSSRIGPRWSVDRSGRSIPRHSTYDGSLKRSFGSKDRDGVPYTLGSRREFSSPERSHVRRSPAYGKTMSKWEYIEEDQFLSRHSGFARGPLDKHSYKETYSSHESRLHSAPRGVSYAGARGLSLHHDDYGYKTYVERPSNYHEIPIHDYGSISSSKRPHSATEEVHSHYAEPLIRQSRARYDYQGSHCELPYNNNSYRSDALRMGHGSRLGYDERTSRGSAGRSHGFYGTRTTMPYRRCEMGREDDERIYSSYGGGYVSREYVSREYVPYPTEVDAGPYPSNYHSYRTNDGYISIGRCSRQRY